MEVGGADLLDLEQPDLSVRRACAIELGDVVIQSNRKQLYAGLNDGDALREADR